MKICSKCELKKQLSEFHKQKSNKTGHRSKCKSCRSLSDINSRIIEKEKFGVSKDALRSMKYALNNPEKSKNSKRKYDNSEKGKLSKRSWTIKDKILNPLKWYEKSKNDQSKYRKALRLATPKNFTPFGLIQSFYPEVERLSIETGVMHSVDHIIPIQGKNVSGLNVPWNIQIIPFLDNCSKGNRFNGGDLSR